MATLKGSKATSGVQARRLHAGVYAEEAVYTSSATMSAGDVIQMVKVQEGERVVDVMLASPTEPVLLSVGDGNDTDRYVSTASVTTTIVRMTNQAGMGYEYTADDTVDIRYKGGQSATTSVVLKLTVWKVSDN